MSIFYICFVSRSLTGSDISRVKNLYKCFTGRKMFPLLNLLMTYCIFITQMLLLCEITKKKINEQSHFGVLPVTTGSNVG